VRECVCDILFSPHVAMVLVLTGADEQDVTAGHDFAIIASFEGTSLCASI
jgi:hypothetical protein